MSKLDFRRRKHSSFRSFCRVDLVSTPIGSHSQFDPVDIRTRQLHDCMALMPSTNTFSDNFHHKTRVDKANRSDDHANLVCTGKYHFRYYMNRQHRLHSYIVRYTSVPIDLDHRASRTGLQCIQVCKYKCLLRHIYRRSDSHILRHIRVQNAPEHSVQIAVFRLFFSKNVLGRFEQKRRLQCG